MKTSGSLVIVVEDNAAMLSALRGVLHSAGYRVRTFSSLDDMRRLLVHADSPSCAIVDLDLPRSTALAVQSFLSQTHPGVPVVFVASHPDVPASVKVMKAGALDLLITPFEEQALLKVIHRAVVQERHSQHERHELAVIRERLNALTQREHEVLEYLLRGLLNKQTAAELGTSEKTIKVHRGRIMKKMRVQSIAELVQLVVRFRSASAPAETTAVQRRVVRSRHARAIVGPSAN